MVYLLPVHGQPLDAHLDRGGAAHEFGGHGVGDPKPRRVEVREKVNVGRSPIAADEIGGAL